MINIEDKSHMPSMSELAEFVHNPLFDRLCKHMEDEYSALQKIEYSGEKGWMGWNLKFKKAGRTLCTVYPRPNSFRLLIVVGRREKERVEALLPTLSQEFQDVYNATTDFMDQRWMIFDFAELTPTYEDVLNIIQIRRFEAKKACTS